MLDVHPLERGPLARTVWQIGSMVGFAVVTGASAVKVLAGRRLNVRETYQQTWFLASVTLLPTLLVTIPLGVLIAVLVGSLAGQLGAQNYTGAVVGFVIVGQVAPLICALMIAGVGGSAICADLGARKIREEVDALEVMGIPSIDRLVVPRVLAAVVVTVLLDSLVMVVGVGSSMFVQTIVLGNSSGGFLQTLTQFSQPADFFVAAFKAAGFAVAASIIASYKGLTARGGPGGVGEAVNETVVLAFTMVFVINVVLSELYPVLIPGKGEY
ncbi:MlaE family ABC transporter permease [Sciscionella sediminilitoris]|uniref:MlaE family ABC transporter permease n=1 Tax=Sciscionella sediminilitoris TaxID=1445613 RepID=UPI0004DFAF28|nr:ABC transporter permease [Sciscionella sp. SE31]